MGLLYFINWELYWLSISTKILLTSNHKIQKLKTTTIDLAHEFVACLDSFSSLGHAWLILLMVCDSAGGGLAGDCVV